MAVLEKFLIELHRNRSEGRNVLLDHLRRLANESMRYRG
jgi:hypothetical protein